MAEIVVHHLDQSRSWRTLFLLEELGVEYRIKGYTRNRAFRAPPELREVHPLGKAPVVTVDGVVLAESGAMTEELLDRFDDGTLRPAAGTPEHREYRYWLHYAEGSLMAPLLVKLIAGRVRDAPVPFFLKPIVRRIGGQIDGGYSDPELALHGKYLDDHLAEHDWFVGDAFGAADVVMSYPLVAGAERGAFADRPAIAAWLERIRGREAFRRALEQEP